MSENVTFFCFLLIVKIVNDSNFSKPVFRNCKTSETIRTVCLYECESYLFLNSFKNVSKLTFRDYSGCSMTDAWGYLWLYTTDFNLHKNNKLRLILPYFAPKTTLSANFRCCWVEYWNMNKTKSWIKIPLPKSHVSTTKEFNAKIKNAK